jgi:hypothetical protein
MNVTGFPLLAKPEFPFLRDIVVFKVASKAVVNLILIDLSTSYLFFQGFPPPFWEPDTSVYALRSLTVSEKSSHL